MEGFIFSTVICTPGGKALLIPVIFDSIRLLCQVDIGIPVHKRRYLARTAAGSASDVSRSGTCLIAFSSGFVTVTIILSTGWRPASAIILILGKVISGNREVLN